MSNKRGHLYAPEAAAALREKAARDHTIADLLERNHVLNGKLKGLQEKYDELTAERDSLKAFFDATGTEVEEVKGWDGGGLPSFRVRGGIHDGIGPHNQNDSRATGPAEDVRVPRR